LHYSGVFNALSTLVTIVSVTDDDDDDDDDYDDDAVLNKIHAKER